MSSPPTSSRPPFNRAAFDALLKRRLFFTPSFEIYRTAPDFKGDTKGLFDYGPPGCALQNNIISLWRSHFVLEENMLEIDCSILTPEDVFKTSGHVDKFSDWMCKDTKNGDYLRADHLIQNVLEERLKDSTLEVPARNRYNEILAKLDNYTGLELGSLIKHHTITSPSNNEVHPPIPFNLIFPTTIGPSSTSPAYLRPETAQGQFTNFKKLLEYNQNTLPFASASIGKSFRNEFSPRSGILRVREFLMAEIEHFIDPLTSKRHERFEEIASISLHLLPRSTQLSGSTTTQNMSMSSAVEAKIIDNETLAYFLARIYLFLQKLGIDTSKLRFRQHMANEMAHYATDCWDAELLTSYGWIECVGCADWSAYDLSVHSERTGEALVVRELREEPLRIEEWQIDVEKRKLGLKFRKYAKVVEEAIEGIDQEERGKFKEVLDRDGVISIEVPGLPEGKAELDKSLIEIVRRTRVEHTREYIPTVIEPSSGIGRIFYALLEHVYWHRPGDVARGVLSLPS